MIERISKFVKRFLAPHLSWLLVSIVTGIVAAAASGMGVPFMLKFVFPVVFHQEGTTEPLLLQYVPQLKELSAQMLLLLACFSMPLIFLIRAVAQWLNTVVVNVLGLRILDPVPPRRCFQGHHLLLRKELQALQQVHGKGIRSL